MHTLFVMKVQVCRTVESQKKQSRLAELGHYQSEVDGKFGKRTQEALEAFQKAAGLSTTGLPDPQTLHKLLVERSN